MVIKKSFVAFFFFNYWKGIHKQTEKAIQQRREEHELHPILYTIFLDEALHHKRGDNSPTLRSLIPFGKLCELVCNPVKSRFK